MLTALPTASIIRAALWGFGQLFPFSEFFDNPGQSVIQSAKYLLSWFRIGRYLQMVSIALRDQLIKSIISQFEEQCRESLNRSDNTGEQAGKIGKDGE